MFAPPLPLCPWIEQPSNKCVCLLCEIRSNQRCQIFLWVVTEWEKCLEIRTYKTNTEAILLSQLIYNYRYLKLVVPFFYCNQKVIQRDISLLLTLIWSGIFSRNSLPFNIQFFSSVFILLSLSQYLILIRGGCNLASSVFMLFLQYIKIIVCVMYSIHILVINHQAGLLDNVTSLTEPAYHVALL